MAKPTAAQKALPRHGFEVSRGLLSRAVAAFGGTGPQAGPISMDLRFGLTSSELDVVGTSKPLQASLNRILANIGTLWIRKIEARQRALDLYKTGLMISRWRAVRVKDTGRTFNTRVAIANDTPYLVYVHAKDTPKSSTFLKTELPKITTNISADLTADLYALRSSPAFQRAVKIAILSGSVRA